LLTKNPNTSGQVAWLDKISFRFFENDNSLEKSSETLGVIIPRRLNEKLNLSGRWEEYIYAQYEYFSLFFNTDSLPKNLRNMLHWQIGNAFSGKIDTGHMSIT
jgi:hypothetical protein